MNELLSQKSSVIGCQKITAAQNDGQRAGLPRSKYCKRARAPAEGMPVDFPARQRAFALGIYTTGISLGILVGFMLGGLIAERYECDLITNVFPRTYPKGTSIEVINVEALYSTDAITTELDEREHMTRPFYRNADQFRIRNVRAEFEGGTDVSLAVDTPEDLEKAKILIK